MRKLNYNAKEYQTRDLITHCYGPNMIQGIKCKVTKFV
jgi:hypothetical protein